MVSLLFWICLCLVFNMIVCACCSINFADMKNLLYRANCKVQTGRLKDMFQVSAVLHIILTQWVLPFFDLELVGLYVILCLFS